jgi:uncharacterized membrane protein YhaH (DUF805 family)
MSSPATDPIGGKPEALPARPRGAAGVLALLLFLSSFFLWPIFFVIDLVVGLVRTRGLLFPVGFRARRKHFWNVLGIYLLLGFVVLIIYAAADDQAISRTTANVIAGIMGAAIAASLLAVAVSRLHDRDLSGWWVCFYCGIPAAAIAVLARGKPADWEVVVFGTLITVFVPWAVFALGCRVGSIGPNRFGEESPWFRDTRRRRAAAAPPPIPQSIPAAVIPAPTAATQAPALVMQAPVAAVVSSTAETQPAQLSAPPALADNSGPVRRVIGDLISVNGRIDPSRFWICTAIQCAYALLAWLVIHLVISDLGISARTYWISVAVIAFLPAALSMIASGVKRLHDRDLSGWWLPGFLMLAAGILEAYFLIFDQQLVMDGPFIVGIWVAAIYLVARTPGTVGPNRFGPDPLD